MKSKHFSFKELSCRCGCGMLPSQSFIDKLDEIREAYGKPILLTCAARCSVHNRAVGGARKSAHVDGLAADLARTPELLAFIKANLDKFNIWLESDTKTLNWIHIQTRPCVGGRTFLP